MLMIDLDTAIDAIQDVVSMPVYEFSVLCDKLEYMAVDTEPVRNGRWSLRSEEHIDTHTGESVDVTFYLECSECGRRVLITDEDAVFNCNWRKMTEDFPYCHCGAKMSLEV